MDASALLSPPFSCDLYSAGLVLRSTTDPSEHLVFTCTPKGDGASVAAISPSRNAFTYSFCVSAGGGDGAGAGSQESGGRGGFLPSRSSRVPSERAPMPSCSDTTNTPFSAPPLKSIACYGLFGVTQIYGSAYAICIDSCRLVGFVGAAPLLQISSFHLVQVPPFTPARMHETKEPVALSTRTLRGRGFLRSYSKFLAGATVTITSRSALDRAATGEPALGGREGVASRLAGNVEETSGTTGAGTAGGVQTALGGDKVLPGVQTTFAPGERAVESKGLAAPPPGVRSHFPAVADAWLNLLCDGLCEGAFYFSPMLDLTKNLQAQLKAASSCTEQGDCVGEPKNVEETPTRVGAPSCQSQEMQDRRSAKEDPSAWTDRFSSNRHFMEPITQQTKKGFSFCVQVIQGYIGWGLLSYTLDRCVYLCVISRRDGSRAGARFHSRGLNAAGSASNLVETEQILLIYTLPDAASFCAPLAPAVSPLRRADSPSSSISPRRRTYQGSREGASSVSATQLLAHSACTLDVFSFVQIRGSIPLVWRQTPTLKWAPEPAIAGELTESLTAATRHFDAVVRTYGPTTVVNLVDKKGKEKVLGDMFAHVVAEQNNEDLSFVWFDFHQECSKMRWSNLSRLCDQVQRALNHQHYFHAVCKQPVEGGDLGGWKALEDGPGLSPPSGAGYFLSWREGKRTLPGWGRTEVCRHQCGVFRVNCIDCLDRTNVVESVFAKQVLSYLLRLFNGNQANQYRSPGLPLGDQSISSSASSSASSSCSPSCSSSRHHRTSSAKDGPFSATVEATLGVGGGAASLSEPRNSAALMRQGSADPLAPLPFTSPEGEQLFRNLWTDNADALSLLYSGTPALKTDFTRTGIRTRWGALSDARNSFVRYLLNNFFDGYKQDCFTFFFQAASYPNSSFETELVPPKRFHAGLRRVLFESVMLFLFLLFVLPVLPSSFVFSGVYGAGYRLTEALLAFCSLPFQIVLRVLSTLLSYTFLGIPFPSILRPFAFPAEGLLFESLIGADGHWSELLKKVGGFIWLFTFSLLCSLAYIFIRAAAVVSVPQLLPDSP